MIVDLVESSSNQRFVFASNKLRESIGASELRARAGVHWVLQAVEAVNGSRGLSQALGPDGNTAALREALRDERCNPWPGADNAVHVVLCTSGKALLLVRDEGTARRINQAVTRRVVQEAPGLDVSAAFAPVDATAGQSDGAALEQAIGQAFALHEQARRARPDPAARFAWSPVFAPCGSSGLPAYAQAGQRGLRSRVALAKLDAAPLWERRIRCLLGPRGRDIAFPENLDKLGEQDGADWLALVHADGNGLGRIFQQFGATLRAHGDAAAAKDMRAYVRRCRDFSQSIEHCTEQSFLRALLATTQTGRPRRGRRVQAVYPVVLGGDDLTALVTGRDAFVFVRTYLEAFEELTAQSKAITAVAGRGLTASAGMAIVKPHFPFHAAYDLAEALARSAKSVKRLAELELPPLSSLDAHVLHDSSYFDLETIRERLQVGDGAQLFCRPWVLGCGPDDQGGAAEAWLRPRRFSALQAAAAALARRDGEGRRRLPSSQTHRLRLALRAGAQVAEATLNTLRHRYAGPDWQPLLEDDALFFADTQPWAGGGTAIATRFLDALELAPFLAEDTLAEDAQEAAP